MSKRIKIAILSILLTVYGVIFPTNFCSDYAKSAVTDKSFNNQLNEEEILTQIKTLEEQNGDKNKIAKLYLNLGDINGKNKNYNKMLEYNKKVVKLLYKQKDSDQILLAGALLNIGLMSGQLCDYQTAAAALTGTIAVLKDANMIESKPNRYNDIAFKAIFDLAEIYKVLHRYDKAKEYYLLLGKTQKNYNPAYDIQEAMAYYSLGVIYEKEGNDNDALKNYGKAVLGIKYYKHEKEPEGQAILLSSSNGYGKILIKNNKNKEAKQVFNAALNISIFSPNNDLSILSNIYEGLGLASYNLKDYNEAKVYYQKAIDIYDEFFNPSIDKKDKAYQIKLRKNFPRSAQQLGNVIIVPDENVFDTYRKMIDIYKKTNSGSTEKLESDLKAYNETYSQNFRDLMKSSTIK